jgi:hypothetical protein
MNRDFSIFLHVQGLVFIFLAEFDEQRIPDQVGSIAEVHDSPGHGFIFIFVEDINSLIFRSTKGKSTGVFRIYHQYLNLTGNR